MTLLSIVSCKEKKPSINQPTVSTVVKKPILIDTTLLTYSEINLSNEIKGNGPAVDTVRHGYWKYKYKNDSIQSQGRYRVGHH
jgi:hypothetical protein